MTEASKLAIVLGLIAEAVKEAGPTGIQSGKLYPMLAVYDCMPEQFEAMMNSLVRNGAVLKHGDTYIHRDAKVPHEAKN